MVALIIWEEKKNAGPSSISEHNATNFWLLQKFKIIHSLLLFTADANSVHNQFGTQTRILEAMTEVWKLNKYIIL